MSIQQIKDACSERPNRAMVSKELLDTMTIDRLEGKVFDLNASSYDSSNIWKNEVDYPADYSPRQDYDMWLGSTDQPEISIENYTTPAQLYIISDDPTFTDTSNDAYWSFDGGD